MKILMILSFYLLSSCAVIPYPYHEIYEGHEIEKSSINWLESGITNRLDVIKKLGEPNLSFAEQNAIVYMWGGQEGGLWVVVLDRGAIHHVTARRSLIILFDKNNVVTDYTFVDRASRPIPYDYKPSDTKAAQDNWRNILAGWLNGRKDKSAASTKRGDE